jgi:hypothetical protein
MSTSQKRRRSPSPPNKKKARLDEPDPGPVPGAPAKNTEADLDADYAELMRAIGETTGASGAALPQPPPPAPRRKNPFAGNRNLVVPSRYGSSTHDAAHFTPNPFKPKHGVWQGSRTKVREWLQLALDSIHGDDDFVVASKRGTEGGYNFLIDMAGKKVGYVSGLGIDPHSAPPARHIAVYLNKNGRLTTAFPCTPDMF